MATEDPVLAALVMDRSPPLGNSLDADDRRALHTKVKNREDEPIFVTFVVTPGTSINNFYEASSVPTNVLTTIGTYVVPADSTFTFGEAEVSGSNIALYEVLLDGDVIARKRTWFGGPLYTDFDFTANLTKGLVLTEGQTILVRVIHQRPDLGDFEARILGVLQ